MYSKIKLKDITSCINKGLYILPHSLPPQGWGKKMIFSEVKLSKSTKRGEKTEKEKEKKEEEEKGGEGREDRTCK